MHVLPIKTAMFGDVCQCATHPHCRFDSEDYEEEDYEDLDDTFQSSVGGVSEQEKSSLLV